MYFKYLMKKILIAFIIAVPSFGMSQLKQAIRSFPLQEVKLLKSVFLQARETDMAYIMALDPDRLLAPFLREAGLGSFKESYPNWENTGLDGHTLGHYLSALSLMFASTNNIHSYQRLDHVIQQLKKCQDKNGNGYIGAVPGSRALWDEVSKGKLDVNNFGVNGKWVPLYNIHKTYAGLRDAWLVANYVPAKKVLVDFCDWMINTTSNLSDTQLQQLLSAEHGGLNEVFADVYAITGDKKYLDLAIKFSHKAILDPLKNHQDRLNNLHANTQIPKVIGFERIATVNGDTSFHAAATFFWETVVNHRTIAIGGNSVREHFNPAHNFSSMITSEQGPETCNTYNMLRLSKMLYETNGSLKYIDFYERALYNHILSSQHPEKGGFVYFTPIRPGHYRVYSQPQTSFWCCVGSGMENHAKYNELIYAHDDKNIFVNLFIPSLLTWKEKGIFIRQETLFPEAEQSILKIESAPADFILNIRYPVWVAPGALKIWVNEKPVHYSGAPGTYIAIKRRWKKGDKIIILFPMRTTTEQLPDSSGYVAVLHGPIVLAAKTGNTDMKGLFADDSRMGHVARDKQYPLQEMPMFVSNSTDISSQIHPVPGKKFTFTAANLIYPQKYSELSLIPFYKVHDSRYVVYWQKASPEKLKEIRQSIAEQQAVQHRLAAQTIDVVYAGEQQPESDHFIESENSATGVNRDRHWRDAKGWFSYKLNDKEKKAEIIRVTYFGRDRDRRFKILVNDVTVADVTFDGSRGNDFFTVDYPLPSTVTQNAAGVVKVKFLAEKNSNTAGIYEVRLLKK